MKSFSMMRVVTGVALVAVLALSYVEGTFAASDHHDHDDHDHHDHSAGAAMPLAAAVAAMAMPLLV